MLVPKKNRVAIYTYLMTGMSLETDFGSAFAYLFSI